MQYELDNPLAGTGGRVLAASAGDLTTYYLYGLRPIGELTDLGLMACLTAATRCANL